MNVDQLATFGAVLALLVIGFWLVSFAHNINRVLDAKVRLWEAETEQIKATTTRRRRVINLPRSQP